LTNGSTTIEGLSGSGSGADYVGASNSHFDFFSWS
jgi:hypothetical protein